MRNPPRTRDQTEACIDLMTVDAIVAAALRYHGHTVRDAIAQMLEYHETISMDLLEFNVDVDLGYAAPDGSTTTVRGFSWEPAGRYRLDAQGLRSVSMAVTTDARWVGPGTMLERAGNCLRSTFHGSHLVVDRADWPESYRIACEGRTLREIVDHPWLQDDRLVVTACTKEPDQHFVKLWVEEVFDRP